MLIRNEAVQAKHAVLDPVQIEKERVRAWVRDAWQDAKVLVNPDESPTNWDRQAGRRLLLGDLEAKLLKLNMNLSFEVIPQNPMYKYLWHTRSEGRIKVCLYNNRPYIPEFSIFDYRWEDVPDPDLNFVDRKDLPKAEWKGLEYDPETGDVRGEGWDFGDQSRPGIQRVKRPWHELVRGWRTILAYLLTENLTSLDAIEREFGSCDRISWAAQTGRAVHNKPF